MMMFEPVIGVAVVMMCPEFRRRAAMMMSEPVIGVAVVMMVVQGVRRSWLFSENRWPGEHNYNCAKDSNN